MRRGRQVNLLLLNIPNHSSTARNVMELSIFDSNICTNGRDFYQVVVSAKVMLELTVLDE